MGKRTIILGNWWIVFDKDFQYVKKVGGKQFIRLLAAYFYV